MPKSNAFYPFFSQTSVKRMGRWIDFKNDYKTLYPWFMETVWYDEDDLRVYFIFIKTASDADAEASSKFRGMWNSDCFKVSTNRTPWLHG